MKNIGEQLEQARNARGLTLKDAVAYTKIKQEFLECMEKNDFTFNLPDVYRRGFLRLYAEYLKLDGNEIMHEYRAMKGNLISASPVKLLEKIAAKENMLSNDALHNTVEADVVDSSERFDADKDYFDSAPSPLESDAKYNYLKIGLICSSVFLGIIIIFFLIRAIASGSDADVESTDNVALMSSVSSPFTLTLAAKPNQETFVNLYYEGEENSPVYAGVLASGASKDFEIRASGIVLGVTDIERISLFKNGEEVDLSGRTGSLYFNVTAPAN